MRTVFFGSVALIAIGISVAANAADMPVKAPTVLPEPPYNWSGAYVGAQRDLPAPFSLKTIRSTVTRLGWSSA
jgi:hypothetical protein